MIRSQLATLMKDELAALRRFALLLTRSYEDAEDLAQDTIERALLKAHLFDGENLRSWLFTVCRRIFLNNVRRTKSRGTWTSIDDAPSSKLGVEGDQESAVEFRRFAACFEQLPPRDRDILSMIAINGARYEEAAEALDVPIGTVRSRLSRARTKLHDLFEGEALPASA